MSKSILSTRLAFALIVPFALLFSSQGNANPAPAKSREVTDWCPQLTLRLPKVNVAECRASQFKASGALSYNGFPILVRDLTSKSKKPIKVLLLGGIHGDELTASAIIFKWLALAQKESNDFHWRFAPVLNPDGLLAKKPKRVNARGVDLNRNFPTPNWDKEAPQYWATTTKRDPRRFPGKTAASEPESQWVIKTIKEFRPDVIISVHAPFGVLDFDGAANPPERFGRLVYRQVGVYPGSLGNYGGLHQNIPVVTIELPHATNMPVDTEIQRIWLDMQKWIRENMGPESRASWNAKHAK